MNQRQKYYYDPETCSFKRIESTWREWIAYAGQILGLAVVLAGLSVWALDVQWVSTPQEKTLEAEKEALERQLNRVNDRMTVVSTRLDTLAKKDRELYRRLFQIEPISEDVRQVGVGGTDPYSRFEKMGESTETLLRSTAQKLDKLERQISLQRSSYRELHDVAERRRERLRQLPAIQPANGPITSGYGVRRHPILKVRKMHPGVDFLLQRGTPVVATANGTVKSAEWNRSYGNVVELRHPKSGYATRYAHLSKIPDDVYQGAEIQRGDTIGYSGNTGQSTGPHLHYEVRNGEGKTLDPIQFFVPDMSPKSYSRLEQRTQQYRAQVQGNDTAKSSLAARQASSSEAPRRADR